MGREDLGVKWEDTTPAETLKKLFEIRKNLGAYKVFVWRNKVKGIFE